jgi:hypothetical protein
VDSRRLDRRFGGAGGAGDRSGDPDSPRTRAWLFLGVMALIGSGLLAVLLVLSRTPGIQDVFPLKDLFRAALVVHVDLSVAVWFMAFAAVIWSALGGTGGLAWLGWSWLSAWRRWGRR